MERLDGGDVQLGQVDRGGGPFDLAGVVVRVIGHIREDIGKWFEPFDLTYFLIEISQIFLQGDHQFQ